MTPIFKRLLLATFIDWQPAAAIANTHLIPLVKTSDGIEAVEATVGNHTGLFLFDSGIGTSLSTPSFAAEFGCRPWGKVTGFRATGDRVDLPRCNETTMTIGKLTTFMPQVSVMDLAKLIGPVGSRLRGIIGLDVFAGHVITLDVAHHQTVIEDDQSLHHIQITSHEIPLRIVRSAEGAALTADMGVPTVSGQLWMELDTGDYGPSLIDQKAARLVSLDPENHDRQAWKLSANNDYTIEGPAQVKDLILDGDPGRDVKATVYDITRMVK